MFALSFLCVQIVVKYNEDFHGPRYHGRLYEREKTTG